MKGLLRETAIHAILAPLLPPPYRIGSGIIIDTERHQSRQTDVLVYDESIYRPFYEAGGAGIYGIESVVATVEIKSVLDKRDIVQAFRAAEEVATKMVFRSGCPPYEPFAPGTAPLPLGVIFAYRCQGDPGEKVVSVANELGFDLANHLQWVAVPGKNATRFLRGSEPQTFNHDKEFYEVRKLFGTLLNSLGDVSRRRGRPKVGLYFDAPPLSGDPPR